MDSTMPTPLHLTRLTGSHLFFSFLSLILTTALDGRFEMRDGLEEEMKIHLVEYILSYSVQGQIYEYSYTHTHTTKSYLLRRPLSD